eukprot:2905556-Prymnesium_polylepis.1
MPLEGDEGKRISKLDVAKRCVDSIVAQLTDADQVALLLFNHESHLLQPMGACSGAHRAALQRKLRD